MKKLIKPYILLLILTALAPKIYAQKVYTVNVGNERLTLKCKSLVEKNLLAKKMNETEDSFTNEMAHKIDSIMKRSDERRKFIKKLKRINASTMPTTFNNDTYIALNQRIETEDHPLADDIAYCDILEKVLSLTKRFKKNKKVYYATSKYEIPEELKSTAKGIFQSAVDDLIRTSNLYKEYPFKALIKTIGYSDDTQINRGSMLYQDMSRQMHINNLTSEEVNNYLSYLRSYDVSTLLQELMKDKTKYLYNPDKLDVKFEKVGFGSKLPGTMNESIPSSKRRVVFVYWHILPNF